MTTLRKAMPFLLLCAALLVCLPLAAQNNPDCSFTFTFTGDAVMTGRSNLSGNTPCVNWRVTLSTDAAAGGTLSSTVSFQTSPDNSTWTAVPNTVCSSTVQPPCILQGVNPIVGAQGMLYAASYGAYVGIVVTASSGTGTGTVRAYGAKGATASALPSNSGGGTVTNIATTSPITGGPITGTGTIGLDTTKVAQKFFGTAAPGSVATNLPGDLFTNTTGHAEYVCNAPSGTAAPACTSVTAAGWLLLNTGGTVTSAFGQTPVVDIPVTTTDISTPANPAASHTKWYTKAGTLCALNPSGVETCTGTVFPGAGIPVSSGSAWNSSLTTTTGLQGITFTGSVPTLTALGTAATQNTGTSGATIPLLSTANTWSAVQSFLTGTYVNASASIGDFLVGSTSTTTPRGIVSGQWSTSTDSARYSGYKARGTQASPTVVVTGDFITRWSGFAYDGTNYLECTSIVGSVTGTVASTRTPGQIDFATCTDATPSVLTTRMTITKNGNVVIGPGTNIAAVPSQLEVTGFSQAALFGIRIAPNNGFAAGLDGSLFFAAKYNTAGDYADFAGITGGKENATDGNVAGFLRMLVNTAGGVLTERLRITSTGDATLSGTLGVTGLLTLTTATFSLGGHTCSIVATVLTCP